MADDQNITVEGIEETLAAFDALSDELAHAALQTALIAAAVPMMETLAVNTPVDTGELLKDMAMSLKVEGKEGEVQIGFPHFPHLVRWLEYGHREVGHEPGLKELGQAQSEPFMRPTEEEAAEASIEAFKTSLDASIDRLAQKHGLGESEAA